MKLRIDVPQALVLTMMLVTMGIILLAQLVKQEDLYFINKVWFGVDYNEFYRATLALREGESPYDIERYVTPPIPALVNIPLTFVAWPIATTLVSCATLLSVIVSLFLVHRLFNVANWIQDGTFVVVSFIILCFSYPFYFLFDRGNIDGFVLLLMCFGVYCLRKWNAIAGVAFALAIASKVYPVLLILPLVSWRRWRALVFLGLSLGLLFLLSPQLWQAFFEERLSTRTAWFRLDENASLANTLFYIGDLFNQGELLRDHHLYVFGTLLFLASCADFTRTCHFEQRECYASMLMYLPFMVAVPQLAYHYELICVLPIIAVISWLWQKSEQGAEKILLGLAAVGIALSQFQAVAAEKLLGAVAPHFLPGFGLFLVMVCVTLHKVVFSANLLSKGLQMLILPRRKVIARGTQNMTLK